MKSNETETNESEPLVNVSYPKWWRGLPSLLMMMIISNIDVLVLNDFVEYRYATYYQLNATSPATTREICLNKTKNSSLLFDESFSISELSVEATTTPSSSISDLVQAATARLNVYIYLSATLPAILTSITLGSNCDKIGRKSLIALPFVGKIIRYIMLTCVSYYALPNWLIVLSVMCDGLCGAASLCILSAFAYVADCTTSKTRTPATIITNMSIASSRILPLVVFGLYLKSHHFLVPMLTALGLSIFGLIFTLLFQPESNVKARKFNVIQQLLQIKFSLIKNILRVYLVKRHGNKQRRLLTSVFIHLGFIVMLCGHVSIFFLYLYGQPFCFDSFNVGILTVIQIGSAVLMTIPFTLTIAKKTDHLFIPFFGCLCYMTQFLILALAKSVVLLYVSLVVGSIFFVTTPVIRSRITKLVDVHEYAVVFILASVFESAGYYAISALTNEIYRLSLTFDSGFTFFILASVGLLPLFAMIYLFVIEKRPVDSSTDPTNHIN